MLDLLKKEANQTYTENGAVTHITTRSDCLDLFATVGALRQASSAEILRRFRRAWAEDPDLAMKILFFARDVRGGLGERRVFRTVLRELGFAHPDAVVKNLPCVAEFGRWDDLLVLLDTPCRKTAADFMEQQLQRDLQAMEKGESVSLLAKWLPSVNASNGDTVRHAKILARHLGMTDAAYRRTLVKLRAQIRILENYLREKDYSFDYAKQPSRAMLKYQNAFWRNDAERYDAFLSAVEKGEEKLRTGTLYPHDIIHPFFVKNVTDRERRAADVAWRSQADFAAGGGNALVVVDGSGSMYGGEPKPIEVALALGIYFAQRNTGAFRDHFITFSCRPQMVQLKGRDILEQVQYAASFNEVANTDLQKVFRLILDTAVKHRVPQEELPQTLYIISDMEFDCCVEHGDLTNFEAARQEFAAHGYALPQVVFWNVQSRNRQQPVTMNEQGVALVSGASPRVFSMVSSGVLSPYAFMLQVLGAERYAAIAA